MAVVCCPGGGGVGCSDDSCHGKGDGAVHLCVVLWCGLGPLLFWSVLQDLDIIKFTATTVKAIPPITD